MIRTENPDLPILNKFSIFLLTVEKKLYCILVISAIACGNDIVKDIMYSEACLNWTLNKAETCINPTTNKFLNVGHFC